MECYFCHTSLSNSGTKIPIQTGTLEICPNCHDDVVLNHGFRYNVDVMIVPVTEESFDAILKTERYICPSGYVFKKKPKFLAFYRGGKIGAITHIGKVLKVISGIPKVEINQILKKIGQFKWMTENDFMIFEIKKVCQLKNKIERSGVAPIQNRVYKTFLQFSRAKNMKDLHNAPERK